MSSSSSAAAARQRGNRSNVKSAAVVHDTDTNTDTNTESDTDNENNSGDSSRNIPGGKVRYEKYTHRWYDTYVLIWVSSWFFTPALMALSCAMDQRGDAWAWIPCITNLLTGILSINYWRNATDGLRRKLDLTIAKISFIVYFAFALFKAKNILTHIVGWPVFLSILISYKLSKHYWKFTKKRWLTYHVIFHLLVVFEQCLIITGSYHKPTDESVWNFIPFNPWKLEERYIKWLSL